MEIVGKIKEQLHSKSVGRLAEKCWSKVHGQFTYFIKELNRQTERKLLYLVSGLFLGAKSTLHVVQLQK